MNVEETARETVRDVRATAENVVANAKNTSAEVCRKVKEKSGEAAECASGYIREKPLPVVAGAVAFGLVVGYLLAYRRPPSLRDQLRGRFDDAVDHARDFCPDLGCSISNGLSRFAHNLKFW